MLNIAICDDDRIYCQSIVQTIQKWSAESGINVKISVYNNGDDLISNQAQHKDIIFLDILMPLLNGMETAREIRLHDTAVRIVFLTSSPDFALESYDVKAHGYLLKPVEYSKIKLLLDECVAAATTEFKNLVIKTEIGYQKIQIYDIEYIEAQNKHIVFYMRSGKKYISTEKLHSIEEKLIGFDGFFKCHRSYLVCLYNIDSFTSSEITTKTKNKLPISRSYIKEFKDAYFSAMFQTGGR